MYDFSTDGAGLMSTGSHLFSLTGMDWSGLRIASMSVCWVVFICVGIPGGGFTEIRSVCCSVSRQHDCTIVCHE